MHLATAAGVVAALLGPAAALAQSTPEATASPFDGAWVVRIDCPNNTEESAAKGYRYEFPASVTNGVLHGRHLDEDLPGSLSIEGPIAPDGSATLRARGRTGNPEYAAKQPGSGTPYTYGIAARFEPTRGSGERLETRVCHFAFRR